MAQAQAPPPPSPESVRRHSPRTPTSASAAQTVAVWPRPGATRSTSMPPRRPRAEVEHPVPRRSLVTNPWIEPGDGQIDCNVQQYENDRVEKNKVLHHEDVALVDRG